MSQPPITADQILTGTGVGSLVALDENALLPIQLSKISTGIFSGGEMSKGTLSGSPLTTTKISVSAGSGIIIDNYTDPLNPTYQLISWPAFIDEEITNIVSAERTFLAISPAGSPLGSPILIQQTTIYTEQQHRDVIPLGIAGHVTNVSVVAVRSDPHAAFDADARLGDLAHAIGPFNIEGNIYTYNGVNLLLDKSVGKSYRLGNNFHVDRAAPDTTTDASEAALEWNYSYQDGAGGFTLTGKVTTIEPANYDDGDGTFGTVATNTWTTQIIKHFPGGAGHRIEYGQTTYSSKAEALAAIPDINHLHNPAFAEGITRGFLVVRGGASDLSLSSDAQFVEGGKFTGGSSGSVSDVFIGILDSATTTQLTLTDTSSTFANRIDAEEVITEKRVSASPTTAYAADLTTGSVFKLTMGGDTAITFSNVPATSLTTTVTFMLVQDAVGSPALGTRTPSFPAAVLWEGGTVPTWTTVANAVDIVTMFTEDGGTTWYANLIGQGYA
jgi:hypothetical protein